MEPPSEMPVMNYLSDKFRINLRSLRPRSQDRLKLFSGGYIQRRLSILRVLVPLLAATAVAQSQANTADLVGVVRDQTGAVLPGVEVTVRNQATDLTRTAVSGGDGAYRVLILPTGTYEVRAALAGFSRAVIQSVVLTVGQYATRDIELQASPTQEEIVVTGNAAVIEKHKTVQASTVEQKEIDNLPINGRNFLDFALLTPGATDQNTLATDRAVQVPTSGVSFGGQDQRSNYVTIDGVDNMDVVSNSVRSTLSQEAIQEFQISRNTFSAEFGRARSGVVNIVSRSGGNDFHGNAFWFLRDDSLDARNAFAGNVDPKFERHQFGGTLGGPLVQDQTFFFLSFERLDREESLFVTFLDDPSIFDMTLRQKELMDFFANSGVPSLQFLSNTFAHENLGVLNTRSGNFPGTLKRFGDESGVFPFKADSDVFSIKVDHRLSSDNQLNLRFNVSDTFSDGSEFGALDAVSNGVHFDGNHFSMVASDTHVFSPTKLNDFKFQVSRHEFNVATNDPIGPQISLAGVAEFGREFFNPSGYVQKNYQFIDNYTVIRGNHTFKTGIDLNIMDLDGFAEVFLGGEFTFAGRTIPLGAVFDATLGPGTAAGLANQLATTLGRPDLVPHVICPGSSPLCAGRMGAPLTAVQSYNFGLPITYFQGFGDPNSAVTYTQLGAYLQDNWRVNENFTLNLGLRYDVDFKPETLNVVNNAPPWDFETAVLSDNNNFAPRLGIAWDPRGDGRQVVRAGYGIFHSNFFQAVAFVSQVLSGQITQVFAAISDPFGQGVTSKDVWNEFQRTGVLDESTLGAVGLRPGTTPGIILPAAGDTVNAYSQQASLGYERQWGADASISLDYLSNKGTRIIRSRDFNVNPVGSNRFAGLRDPRFLQVNALESSGSSIYHGFTTALTRRFRGTHNLRVSYTLGKAIDDVTDFITQHQANNQADLRSERSLSTFDQRHRFVTSGLFTSPWRLSSGQGFGKNLLADWTFSAIATLASGRPFNLLAGFDLNGDSHEETDRPRLISGEVVGRNTGRGPAFYNFDIRLLRQFNAGENIQLQFIVEAFNLFNNVNYNGINNVVGGSAPTAHAEGSRSIPANRPLGFTSAYDPRQIQFGFKLNF